MTQAPIYQRLSPTEALFDYDEAFSRNRGVLSEAEQDTLANSVVSIPGGGVGSAVALTLARMGVGGFVLADSHQYGLSHLSRQFGARFSSLGKNKARTIRDEILEINPLATVTWFEEDLCSQTLPELADGSGVVIDSLGFSAQVQRDSLIPYCQENEIPVILCLPIGYSASLIEFSPKSMAYEKYFDFRSRDTDVDRAVKFAVGLSPKALHRTYMRPRREGPRVRGAALSPAISLCAALASQAAVRRLLGQGPFFDAPYYQQWDLYRGRSVRGYLRRGNRHPLQRLRLWMRRPRKSNALDLSPE